MDISLSLLAELLFASEDTTLDGAREWAARNILDYHASECRVISAELAVSIKEADPDTNVFYILSTGEGNKIYILWRKSAWVNSRHRRFNLKVNLAVERQQRDVIAAKTEAERQHIKACQAWLARFATQFCDASPGYKVSFLRDALFKLASKFKYNLDSLFPALCEILEEDIVHALWVAPPTLKTDEQTEQTEAQEVQSTGGEAPETTSTASQAERAGDQQTECNPRQGKEVRGEVDEVSTSTTQEDPSVG